MSRRLSQSNRRHFIRISALALAAAPFTYVLLNRSAEAAEVLTETDPTAAPLGYKMDATKAPARKDKTSLCSNCNLYTGKSGAADGPCSIFGGKLVNAKGWCSAWVKKA